ncbi:MAG: yqfD [Clostridiales bacterium]|jgi:similar to stage IV sporulation protein|nr:yqfD [Clostridiales bacterium]
MGSISIKDFMNGFIVVNVEGLNPEKFINLCSRNGINLWDINKLSYTVIEFKMKHKEYKYLKEVIKKTSSRTKIIKKKGFHFLYGKIRRRKFFIVGIAIFLTILLYLSNIVWIIDINGEKKIPKEHIYNTLKSSGLNEGILKNKINLREVESSVLKQINEISLINIKFIGTRARVEIVERTMPPNIIPLDKPTNIVAAKNGVISKVLSYKGQTMVQTGDYVKKGQILISGIITDNTNVPSKVVHAMGVVTAKTWYEAKQEISCDFKFEIRTGRLKKKVYYNIMGKKVSIKNDNIGFQYYDKIEEKNPLIIAGYETPIEILTEYYYEKEYQAIKLSPEEAIKMAIKKAEEDLNKLLPKDPQIIEKKIEKNLVENKARVRVLVIIAENIGVLEEIK